jgi:hypothetical protein
MRKIILEDVNVEKEEVRKELGIKEDRKPSNNQTYQPMQYYQQQPQQYNPFQTDTKYEFMLIAMNPIIGFIYQIFKGLSWLRNKR